jgi:hypothetical protein
MVHTLTIGRIGQLSVERRQTVPLLRWAWM